MNDKLEDKDLNQKFVVENSDIELLSLDIIIKDEIKMSDRDAYINLVKSFIGVGSIFYDYGRYFEFTLFILNIWLFSFYIYNCCNIINGVSYNFDDD